MIHWSPSPEIFSVGPLQIRWYGLFFLIGFSIGYKIVQGFCLREKKSIQVLDNLLVYLVIGTAVGARLGHCLFYEPQYFLQHPLEILMVWKGGLASHGGTVGVFVALWLFSRKVPEFSFMWLLDRISIPVGLVAGFIRLGNLMNSEILGKPTDVPWAFIFEKVDQVPRHPAQLYESFTYFALFAFTLTFYKKSSTPPRPGLLFGISMIVIFLSRIFWEFFKENQEAFEAQMTLNMGQLLSIPFVILGFVLVIRHFLQKDVDKDQGRQRRR